MGDYKIINLYSSENNDTDIIDDKLIEVVKNNEKICNYFDIPIQHISNKVLKRMNRKSDGNSIRKTIAKIRKEIPDVVIRTTVMVGFPGETKEDVDETIDDNELEHFISYYLPEKLLENI